MLQNKIIIKGAREHNLKNINLEIPRNELVVITGPSGSGKSSLAFDTIYAEGQRRYVESLSAYARQFLEQMEKPNVESIEGLSPAIAIQQKATTRNPRSTVGTTTEIYDYLRLLFTHIGKPHCPKCGRKILPQSVQQIVEKILNLPQDKKIKILAPLIRGKKGEHQELFNRIRQEGFVRVRINKKIYGLEENIKLNKNKKHQIEVVVDRLVIHPQIKERLTDSVETALKIGEGIILICLSEKKELLFSEHHACIHCEVNLPEISPRIFSFNSPYGACPDCDGLGTKEEIDTDLIMPNKNLSINGGVFVHWFQPITNQKKRWQKAAANYYYKLLEKAAHTHNFSLNTPFSKLKKEHQEILLYGDNSFEGVITNLKRRYRQTESNYVREEIYNKYISSHPCPTCHGSRLRKESLAITVDNKSIFEVSSLSVKESTTFFQQLGLTQKEKIISHQILKEIKSRLSFLSNVGLDYITLNRQTYTLSGGEAQRIHLATSIGSNLVGVLYVLDEPSIGLHQRDNRRLLKTLEKLKNMGNTLIIVEHDEETIRHADYIVDLGPQAGTNGGEIICAGPLKKILNCEKSSTGQYLSGKLKIPIPIERRSIKNKKLLEIKKASQFNLKNIDVKIPLGVFTCITGVSGSGKSTLVQEIIYKALAQKIYKSKEKPGKFKEIIGTENIDKVIVVDQSPIGRTPRSNPATYTGLFTPIRTLFSQIPLAKMRGYMPGRFSFNVKGGRCSSCQGDGVIKIEMQFLPNVYVKCDECNGQRFNEETLRIKYKGKNITEVLEMSVKEALDFFNNIPQIKKLLQTLYDVGLGYIKLGQSATTLSGGEAQRIKLAEQLSRRSTGKTFYILDEPTTGLHFTDIEKLLHVLHQLVNSGNTILVIEHNLEVIKTADYIIDLGPEGGEKGGYIISQGPPEKIIKEKQSFTGQFLRKVLNSKSIFKK